MMTPKEDIEFIANLIDRGFNYDRINDEYVRKWSTETGPQESILEIYKKIWHSDKWKQSMVGYGDNIFYEEMIE
jgi:hypothetical protein